MKAKEASTSDVIILGGGGLENMSQDDEGRGWWAKYDVTVFVLFLGKFQTICFIKIGFIIRNLSR